MHITYDIFDIRKQLQIEPITFAIRSVNVWTFRYASKAAGDRKCSFRSVEHLAGDNERP